MASKPKKDTKEAPETATTTATGPSPAMLALFKPRADVEAKLSKLQRRNMPALTKPESIPVGGIMVAKMLGLFKSPVTTVKGMLLHLAVDNGTPTPTEITFPFTGVIRNALCPGVPADDFAALTKEMGKEMGRVLVLKRLEDKPSKFKRAMFMFDVFTTDAI